MKNPMEYIHKNTYILVITVLLLSGSTYAQSNAIAIFDENRTMRSVELLNSPDNIMDCKSDKASGTITDVEFDANDRITGFRLKTKYERKLINLYVWFPEDAYFRLKEKEADKLTTLVKKRNRVRITFHTCGEKATADFVDSIRRF